MEARLVPQAKYTPTRFRELGVREVGRIGSILFVHTKGPLVLMHVSALVSRTLDEYGIEQAKLMLYDRSLRAVAADLGLDIRDLRSQLAAHGWRQPSLQDGKDRAGTRARLDAGRKHRTGFQSRARSATL
jgi:hypothetical protein